MSVEKIMSLLQSPGGRSSVFVRTLHVEDLDEFEVDALCVKVLKDTGVSKLFFECFIGFSSLWDWTV